MKTTALHLTPHWRQVSEDDHTVMIQLMSGDAAFCVSTAAPDSDAVYHLMPHSALMTIIPPTRVWVRSTHTFKDNTQLIVSTLD